MSSATPTDFDLEEQADEVIEQLRRFTDPERRAHTVNYFPSAMENLGVSVVDLRKVVRTFAKLLKPHPPATVLDFSRAILARNTLEGRQVAYELVAGHERTLETITLKALEELGRGMDNWASVDTFATHLSGQSWREGRISDRAIERWSRSRDRWWRRAAVVSTVPLNMRSRGGSGDVLRTLNLCESLVADSDEMVAKGLSWALRTLIPIDAHAVADFLKEHRQILSKRVVREVSNKLETGRKSGKS